MELNDYQQKAMTTCMESSNNFSYMMLNLVGEVGELASKVAKAIRKKYIYIDDAKVKAMTEEYGFMPNLAGFAQNYDDCDSENQIDGRACTLACLNTDLMKEAGDILWQLSGLCSVMGWTLEEIAQTNLDKLASRKQRNVIDGDGDNR